MANYLKAATYVLDSLFYFILVKEISQQKIVLYLIDSDIRKKLEFLNQIISNLDVFRQNNS